MSGLFYIKRAVLVEVFLLLTLFSFFDMENQREDYSTTNNIAAGNIKTALVIKEITATNTAHQCSIIQTVQTTKLYKKLLPAVVTLPRIAEICVEKNKLKSVLLRLTQFDEI